MRVIIFHGYLLRGTGSNVYNAKLAEALRALGHEIHLLCQEPDPGALPWVDAVGTWPDGDLEVRIVREPVRATVYRPDIGPVLPVYVADRYEGFDARPLPDCSDDEIETYVTRNVAAVRDVLAQIATPGAGVDASLANHAVLGPAILARAGLTGAVKIHGSALEYVVRPHPARFGPWAREGLDAARCVLVGSRHTAESLWSVLGEDLRARTRLGPPGVDVDQFGPRDGPAAAAGWRALADRLAGAAAPDRAAGADAFAMDHAAAGRALARLDPERDRIVAYVGKLIASKGVDLLLAAWPLVLAAEPDAALVVVGFGALRPALEELACALAAGDLDAARALAAAGRAAEGGPAGALHHLRAFLDSPAASSPAYAAAAPGLLSRVVWTGRLDHSELAELLPACEAQVVPSTFPEAYGMVAAEAAACGVLPVSAGHSGLAEVARALSAGLPPQIARLLRFELGDDAVPDLAERIVTWLSTPDAERAAAGDALVATARARLGWDRVARGVLAASAGQLDDLAQPR